MPLAFSSLSHGTVAFGFFNIETDMLLLEQLFFFADRFCAAVVDLARTGGKAPARIAGWRIRQPQAVGDLHGAIAGRQLSGFIGATYRQFPFPTRPEDFKQSPTGSRTQQWMTETVERFGEAESIEIGWSVADGTVSVGPYVFHEVGFGALIEYVERGGYPRYRDEQRPPYVGAMMAGLRASSPPWAPP